MSLDAAMQAELTELRRDPQQAIGFGEKTYIPYEPNVGERLIGSDDPAVTAALLAEARGGGDRVYRLAVVHLLGKRKDATVDAALISLLDDPELRATTAYLLGRPGFKGYPARVRQRDEVIAALKLHLDDRSGFNDPFYGKSYLTQDFVVGALVRLLGPETFTISDERTAEWIGYALPHWSGAVRNELLAQLKSR